MMGKDQIFDEITTFELIQKNSLFPFERQN